MRVLFFLLIGLVTAGSGDKEAVEQDLRKLEGSWKIVKAEGKEARRDKNKQSTTIKGNRIDFGDTKEGLEFIIDPSHGPKWFDLKLPLSDKDVETMLGIYELDGDKLKICLVGSYSSKTGPVRPKEFKAQKTEGGETFVLYLEREKQK